MTETTLPALRQVTPHLFVYEGAGNMGVLRDGDRALLIDCGDTAAAAALAGLDVDTLLFTHHHRDTAGGGASFPKAAVCVPAGERQWFADPESFWRDPQYRYVLMNVHPHHQMLAEGIPVSRTLEDGETFAWGPARITALLTPGHTDAAMSYLVEVDGARVAFTGDLICAPGQIWEQYSLQKGNGLVSDYHGFLEARGAVLASLRAVLAAGAEMLVPAHGVIMPAPAAAVDALEAQITACYDSFAAISALRWYYPAMISGYLDGPAVMPIGSGTPPPPFLSNVSTSWILVSESGAAFVMDCGEMRVIDELQRRLDAGEITSVDSLWITHYHYDHVDAIDEFRRRFGGPIIADPAVAQIVANPRDWRLTCNTPVTTKIDRWTAHGERWQWHEFTLTAYNFPGQSLYHDALLVEGRGHRCFFIGDSFTPAGIDDYCVFNRNFLGAGLGYDRCLALVEELNPVVMFNPHVAVGFTYTAEAIAYMRANLAAREEIFGAMFPWDHPNYGLDDLWAHGYPYEQTVAPGGVAHVEAVITNHSAAPRNAVVRAVLPRAWGGGTSKDSACIIPANMVGRLPLAIPVPAEAAPGTYCIPFDLAYGDRSLPQWTEVLVVVE
jgi:glyoxylase-like metal-dependent hydrolase (beta-lactamase superfamily II)